ncbi:potassium channel family protein [Haloimpatiens sp. FM7315]|uniref:potassium channel family protein n=1 Tax=Haloimpatiens sp. FM7315 TaxID=3298609 RepID=UPI00370A2892
MKAIVVGGGKVGYYLVRTLKEKGFKITIIERNYDLCRKIAEEMDVEAINGDGTDIDVLKDAGIQETEVVAAVTGADEENFVICQSIKTNFKDIDTIARVNNPKNQEVFKALGVDKTVCSTAVISNLIEAQLTSKKLRVLQALDKGEILLVEIFIMENCKWKNKLISNLDIPKGCVIVSILRNEKIVAPSGSIEIRERDRVLVTINVDEKLELEKSL